MYIRPDRPSFRPNNASALVFPPILRLCTFLGVNTAFAQPVVFGPVPLVFSIKHLSDPKASSTLRVPEDANIQMYT